MAGFTLTLCEDSLGIFRKNLGLSHDDFMALDRINPYDRSEPFYMTVLALKSSLMGERSFRNSGTEP